MANLGDHRKGECSREITDLLPWYVNETLEPAEAGRVEQHLTSCVRCKSDVSELQVMQAAIGRADAELAEHVSDRLEELKARVNEYEAAKVKLRERRTWWDSLFPNFSFVFPKLAPVPIYAKATMAVELAVIVALGGWLWLGPGFEPGSAYQTLSAPEAMGPQAFDRPRLQLVFRERLSEREMRDFLLEIGATIVSGPSPLGAYTVQVASVRQTEEAEALVAKLQKDERVRFLQREHGK